MRPGGQPPWPPGHDHRLPGCTAGKRAQPSGLSLPGGQVCSGHAAGTRDTVIVYRALGRRLVHRVQPPSAILTGGAVLRVAGGVFYGLGDPPSEDPAMAKAADEEKSETDSGKQRTPLTMIIPPAVLVVAAIVMG